MQVEVGLTPYDVLQAVHVLMLAEHNKQGATQEAQPPPETPYPLLQRIQVDTLVGHYKQGVVQGAQLLLDTP